MQPAGQASLPANPLNVFVPLPSHLQSSGEERIEPVFTNEAKALLIVSNVAAWGLAIYLGAKAYQRARASCPRL